MKDTTFLELLSKEIEQNPNLYPYYKLNKGSVSRQLWRKAYYIQRLKYIDFHINKSITDLSVLDCGCGYGSTCLFLAMNNIKTRGTTLEYYYEQIESRKKYWAQYGDSSLFEYKYENIFDNPPEENSLDCIILQDTLHHIEPIEKGLNIFYKALKKNGKLILVEVNGACLPESLIFFLKRGNKRIIEYYDEKFQKNIIMGNENFRSEKEWLSLFTNAKFNLVDDSVNYIRFFMPFGFKTENEQSLINKEQKIAKKYNFLKKYGFFGLNMVFTKK